MSKIIAKNLPLYPLEKQVPNDIEMGPRSSKFFKITVGYNVEMPLKILIHNMYDNEIMVYWSKTNNRPDEENHNGKYHNPHKIVIKGMCLVLLIYSNDL